MRILPLKIAKFHWFALLLCLVTSGCNLSLQSNQYNFLKSLMRSSSSIEVPTWMLSWQGLGQLVYPVSLQNETVFTDGSNLMIRFDGWNITRIEGLQGLGALQRVQPVLDRKERDGQQTNATIENLLKKNFSPVLWKSSNGWQVLWYCSVWHERVDGPLGYTQTCYTNTDSTEELIKVENAITLNSLEMIQSIQATFDPASSEIMIQLR